MSKSSVDRDGTIDTGLGSGTFTGSQQDDQVSLADQKIVGVAHTYSDASESECISEGATNFFFLINYNFLWSVCYSHQLNRHEILTSLSICSSTAYVIYHFEADFRFLTGEISLFDDSASSFQYYLHKPESHPIKY